MKLFKILNFNCLKLFIFSLINIISASKSNRSNKCGNWSGFVNPSLCWISGRELKSAHVGALSELGSYESLNSRGLACLTACATLGALPPKSIKSSLEAFKIATKNKTTIIVSHRISSVRHADLIIVLENGQIVQKGRHIDLINVKGYYKELSKKQHSDL